MKKFFKIFLAFPFFLSHIVSAQGLPPHQQALKYILESQGAFLWKAEEQALATLYKTRNATMRDLGPEHLWHDLETRSWIVERKNPPGDQNTTHLLHVTCKLNDTLIKEWDVNIDESVKETSTPTPHAEALLLVIEKLKDQPADWQSIKKQIWTVKRPIAPGVLDSTHWFNVKYQVDEKPKGQWQVDTKLKTVTDIK